MNFIKLLPVILSMLLLGAHFFRYGHITLVILTAALPVILLVRKSWVARLFQAILVIGSIEWIRTLVVLAKMRQATGAPWIRLAVILGPVAALAICSAFVFRFKSVREWYRIDPSYPTDVVK
jgi:hypothetical protein